MAPSLSLTALDYVPEVRAGDSLDDILCEALAKNGLTLADGDVVAVCQKIVSKAERRTLWLADIAPGPEALRVAALCGKDPRFVEAVLGESIAVLRTGPNLLIVRHRLGLVVANAGIDQSNVEGEDAILLLPEAPDDSAAGLREAVRARLGADVGVVITDSFGRAWRLGVTGVCIGCAGLTPLMDERGRKDRFGRELRVTMTGLGDAVAAAAMLLTGEAAEGRPIVVIRGLERRFLTEGGRASDLLRPAAQDVFL